MSLAQLAMERRLLVCVGTGGVGKTTIAAAIALGAAIHGRRVAVLTIDPARQLARSLGLDSLEPGGQLVPDAVMQAAGVTLRGTLHAGMLDQKSAWDAFMGRLIPSDDLRRRVLDNPFYVQLSTSFPGSNEYMAIEEVCRLAESDRFDLIVLDTPPAAHALEFLRAPQRIDRLLDREVIEWVATPYSEVRGGMWRTLGRAARHLLRRLERATGQASLNNISSFFIALAEQIDALIQRTRQARMVLYGPDSAFVLVARPQQLVIAETAALATELAALRSPLAAVVANRVHPLVDAPTEAIDRIIDDAASGPAAQWLRWAWRDALGEAMEERVTLDRLSASLPVGIARAEVPEADHDVHSVADLAAIAGTLWS